MSAQLKTFIDRLGDLFSIRQDLGDRPFPHLAAAARKAAAARIGGKPPSRRN